MVAWGEVIPDIVLATLYVYLIVCIATSADQYFKKAFYVLFTTTGVYSVISVVSFIIMSQFSYSEKYGTTYIYRISFAINVFGASGATFGKAVMSIHRYLVMRNRDFSEQKWSSSTIHWVLLAQFAFSAVLTAPVWLASYVSLNDVIQSISADYFLVLKICSISMYVVYIMCNTCCTILTSRELYSLGKGNADMRSIVVYQRNMFIIVTGCSLSHLLKAFHQFALAAATYFELKKLDEVMFSIYPVVNGLATYAAPVCLVIFSSKVRTSLLCRRTASPLFTISRSSR